MLAGGQARRLDGSPVVKTTLKIVALWTLRACGGFALGRLLTRRAVMIVGWHGVSQADEHQYFPSLFIRPDELRRRLSFLVAHYRVIDLDELARQHQRGWYEPRQVVLTFDDGFHNFSSTAVPILRDAQAVATNYLVSEPLVDDRPNYRMLVRSIARRRTRDVTGITLPQGHVVTTAEAARMLRFEQAVLADFDSGPERADAQEVYARRLADLVGVDIADQLSSRMWHVMTRDDVARLAAEGFGMELHTHRHRNVVDFADQVDEEVRTCRAIVETVAGKAARHFCYPAGLWQRAAWPALRGAGVVTATTTMLGPNFPTTPLLALRRVLNGEDRSQLEFEFEMSNLRWLWALLTRRAHWSVPSEKVVPFRDVQLHY